MRKQEGSESAILRMEELSMPEPNSGCLIWLGAVSKRGYGSIWHNGKNYRSHRLMYILTNGDVPEGLVLDHKCRVRSCINPDHLEPVTNRENIMRGVGITAQNARKMHCPYGHELTPDNVYLAHRKDGIRRRCKICENRWRIAREKRKRENGK